MKLLLVLDSEDTCDLISLYLKPLGFDLIHYRQPLKAMDNIDEIDPAAVILSAQDFPRHWKILVQNLRSSRPKEKCPIIILRGEQFSLEETAKAFFLGVNGIVEETLDTASEIDRLQNILGRYIPIEDKRKARRYHAEGWNRFGFLIASPKDSVLITGEVKTISGTGLSFFPDHSSLMTSITLNTELTECSLRAGDTILSPICKLIRSGRIASFEFVSFPEHQWASLETYLEGLPLQELRSKQQNRAKQIRFRF